MADQHHPDDLASLRARLDRQEAAFASFRARVERRERRRRVPRRALPLVLAALLVALVPLATLAATPFTDLTGGPHDGNIDAIYAAGITKGCDPTHYCPTANVTREEMASFLARTAGLGSNPPVANAKTAQSATTAQTATNAITAANAQNAAALGGQPPSAFLPAGGDTTYRYPGIMAVVIGSVSDTTPNSAGGLSVTLLPGQSGAFIVPLPRATGEHGRPLAVKALRVCYRAEAGIKIDNTTLYANERGTGTTTLIDDGTDRTATDPPCYDLTVATPAAIGGANTALIAVRNTGAPNTGARDLTLDSLALTLTPLTTGTP